MKKTIALSLLALTTTVNAQIKIFPGGLQAYGSTTSPAAGLKHQFTGDLAVSETGTTTTNCALIRANGTGSVSSATRPEYTWLGDNNTGMFHPSADVIGFTTNGTEKFRINTTGQLLSVTSNTSASYPDYSWNTNSNTGIFHPATNAIGFTLNGIEKWRMVQNGQLLSISSNTSASYPDYTWNNDNSTGIFHPATNVIGFSINSSEALRIHSNKKVFIATAVNTGTPWADGQLNVSNVNVNEASVNINHNANADWMNSMATYVNRANTGNYAVQLNGSNTFYVAGAGWIYSQGNYLGSDINIKDDIHIIDSASAKINRIKGVTYKLKKEKQNPNQFGLTAANEYMGVIAQDIEKVAPQAVKTVHDGTKAVAYEMLIGLLIEGFKEQSSKITQLQSDLNTCCTKNDGGKTTNRLINQTSTDDNTANEAQSYIKQNKPNPFSNETIIEYNIISKENTASIMIFDMNGKLLKTYAIKEQDKGQLSINGKELNPGLYYYSLVVDGQEIDTKKMIITQ